MENNIARGKKWTDVRAKYVFEKRLKDVEWLDAQKSIVEDIKEYEASLKSMEPEKPKEPEETKSKKEK